MTEITDRVIVMKAKYPGKRGRKPGTRNGGKNKPKETVDRKPGRTDMLPGRRGRTQGMKDRIQDRVSRPSVRKGWTLGMRDRMPGMVVR